MKRLRHAWRVTVDAFDRFNRNDGWAMAGYVAFTGFLSIFPFLIFVTALIGLYISEEEVDDIVEALFQIAPPHVALTLEPAVHEVVSRDGGGLLTVSAAFALFVASNTVESVRVAFDRAYQVIDPRGIVSNRVLALFVVLLGAIVAALLGVSIILSPLIIRIIQNAGVPVPGFASYISYGFGLIVFVIFLRVLHRVLPGRRMSAALLWPGVLVSALLWVVAALGFSIYLSFTPTYTVTYGALAGVMITLMFFYITGATIIFGAELNAAINRAKGWFTEDAEGGA